MIKLDRSYFFEFSGMPKSGKTTVIESIRHFFRRKEFSVKNFNGHDRNVPIDKRDAVELNMVLAAHACEYINTYSVADNQPTLHFLDRGIFDRAVFTEKLRREGKLDDEEAESIKNFLLTKQNCKLIDHLFVFAVDPKKSLDREYSKTLIPAPGRVMNQEYLESLQITLFDCYESYKNRFRSSEIIFTDSDAPKETGLYIAKQIWEILGGQNDEFPIF